MFFQDFIYAKEDALAPELCDNICTDALEVISHIIEKELSGEITEEDNKGWIFGEREYEESVFGRKDVQIFMPPFLGHHRAAIRKCLDQALNEYQLEVTSAKTQKLYTGVYKFQLTPPKGGFHKWHIDQGPGSTAGRSLVWMIYLNDMEDDSGGTEFLYQGVNVVPKKGKIVLWPAGITHPHRGNPPYAHDKMVLTGWFSCPSSEHLNYGQELMEQAR